MIGNGHVEAAIEGVFESCNHFGSKLIGPVEPFDVKVGFVQIDEPVEQEGIVGDESVLFDSTVSINTIELTG